MHSQDWVAHGGLREQRGKGKGRCSSRVQAAGEEERENFAWVPESRSSAEPYCGRPFLTHAVITMPSFGGKIGWPRVGVGPAVGQSSPPLSSLPERGKALLRTHWGPPRYFLKLENKPPKILEKKSNKNFHHNKKKKNQIVFLFCLPRHSMPLTQSFLSKLGQHYYFIF